MENIHIHYDVFSRKFVIEWEGLSDIVIDSSLGAKCLYHLISNKNRSFKPTILRRIIENNVNIDNRTRHTYNITTRDEQLLYQTLNQYIEASDMKTIIDINKEKKKIELELLEAKANNDFGRIDELTSNLDILTSYVKDVLNINGTFRNLNQNRRKATKSIQRGIELVMQEIAEQSKAIYEIIDSRLTVSINEIKYLDDDNDRIIHLADEIIYSEKDDLGYVD